MTFTDTQIAYDPIDQRWLATTLAKNAIRQTGDLLFAISTGTSALDGSGVWQRYDIPVCTSNNNGYNFPDQPILGYSSSWAAVDTVCTDVAGDFTAGTDALVLIPNSSIVTPPQTLNPTIITPPLFASRPSRDVSGSGYSQLVLASAQFDPNIPPSAPPHVALYGIGASPSPTPIGNSPNAWGFSGGGSSTIPDAPQAGCTVPSSNCMIDATDQGRTQQVTLQYNPTTQKHYLLTSFTAGYQSGAEVLWYIDELETGTWAGQFAGTGSTGWVPTYTTITADQDFDINATATSFTSNGFPFSIEFAWHTSGMLGLPETNFANSAAAYTGQNTCPTPTPTGSVSPTPSPSATPTPQPTLQRWGDYNSLIWDPSLTSSSGEKGLFWSVLEFTQGAADQSTAWTPFNDPFVAFVGSSFAESECSNPSGTICSVTVTAPSGVQTGDALLVAFEIAQNTSTPPTLPAGWRLLPTASPGRVSSHDTCGGNPPGVYITSWLAAYIYGSQSGDNGTYTFTHVSNHYLVCGNSAKWLPEALTFMVAYRGVVQDLTKYGASGYGETGHPTTFSVGPVTLSSGESMLVGMVSGPASTVGENNEANEAAACFASGFVGNPAMTLRIPLSGNNLGFIAGDVPVPGAGGAFGSYSTTMCNSCTAPGCLWFGWLATLPEF